MGGCMWPVMPISKLAWAIPVKSDVWKFGSDWLSLSRVTIWIFRGGRNSLSGGVTCDLQCPFSNLDELFQSIVMCENLVWIGWNQRYVDLKGGGRPPIRGDYMRPAMPIFELGQAILDKSHVWKFGLDWLSLSRVIVVTYKKKKKKSQTQLKTISLQKILSVRVITWLFIVPIHDPSSNRQLAMVVRSVPSQGVLKISG